MDDDTYDSVYLCSDDDDHSVGVPIDVCSEGVPLAPPSPLLDEEGETDCDVLAFDKSTSAEAGLYRASESKFWKLLKTTWARDPLPTSIATEPLAVFQMDCNYTIGRPSSVPEIAAKFTSNEKTLQEAPIIQMYGVMEGGQSVVIFVHGFFPYLYCECPQTAKNCDVLRNTLKKFLALGPGKINDPCVLGVEIVKRESLVNFSNRGPSDFFKITTSQPRHVAAARRHIEQGINMSTTSPTQQSAIPPTVYEANIPYALRFMVDRNIMGCTWIQLRPGTFFPRPDDQKASHCQLEVDVHYSDVVSHAPEGEWLKIAPLRVLSLDIECVKKNGKGFPIPSEDPIIQIGNVVKQQGDANGDLFKVIFTLNSCSAIPGAHVFYFSDEREMLQRWQQFVSATDPDVLTGYNSTNFDLNYIIERSTTLNIPSALLLGRLKNVRSRVKDSRLSSKGLGTHDSKDLQIDGRLQMDMLVAIRRDYKLKSYTLNAVSAHYLNEQKEDVHYSMIGDLYRGNAETRKRIAVYCLKDAELPLRLLEKLMFMYNYIEMARVTGVPLPYLLTRGQQIKVTSQLLRKCQALKYLIPSVKPSGSGEVAYEGATVLDPKKGFYTLPIATLDFASLYPSIMMAHNLCYCTLVPQESLKSVPADDYLKTPSGSFFVKKEIRKGVLPMIVEELITARKRARAEMAKADDPFVKAVLNGRQLALKISANSVYGYTGAAAGGQLPCLDISSSITAYGRDMIHKTRDEVESHYTVENGYEFNADIIYGDTDSVMIKFGTDSIEEAMRLGCEAASRISGSFPHPIKLEFEKVFCPFLLMNKKRYAGLLYTKPEKYDYMDCKGIETVRRDFCVLVQQLVDQSLKKLLVERDVEGAKAHVRTVIADLLQHKVDMSLLVMSKSIGKDDYAGKLAHVELAKKLRKRDPATAPQIGDRVHYVITQGAKKQPQYDRAEDPLYVLEHNMAIDTDHYLEALKKPLTRVFEAVMEDPSQLFVGSHTLAKKILVPTTGAMASFLSTSLRCLSCRAVIKDGAFCPICKASKEQQVVLDKVQLLSDKQREFAELWTQCQRCQGSLHQEVICTSRDCPIFYRRMKIMKDIDSCQNHVSRLSVSW